MVFRSAPILLIVVVSAILIFLTRGWNNTQHDVSRKIPITIRCCRQVLPLNVSEKSVGKLKKLAARMFHIPKKMSSAIVFRLGSKIFHDEMTWSDIHSNCELQIGQIVKGGKDFDSIPVKNVRHLMCTIKSDFDQWIHDEKPLYRARYLDDPLEGSPVIWDGYSGSIQYFFKTKNINPCEKYAQFYSKTKHTVAVSYVWSATSILRMAGTCCFFFYELPFCASILLICSDQAFCFQMSLTSQNTRMSMPSSTCCVCLRTTCRMCSKPRMKHTAIVGWSSSLMVVI